MLKFVIVQICAGVCLELKRIVLYDHVVMYTNIEHQKVLLNQALPLIDHNIYISNKYINGAIWYLSMQEGD